MSSGCWIMPAATSWSRSPRVASLEALNQQLVQCCQNDLQRQLRGQTSPKQSLLAEEQHEFLRPLPEQTFEPCRLGQGHADSLSLVRIDTNSYSVPTKYAHRQITIVATIAEVRLLFEETLIARHQRDWGRELNECLACHNNCVGSGLSDSPLPMSVNCQCPTGIDCQFLQSLDPALVKLIDVWESVPPNTKKAVEALCL